MTKEAQISAPISQSTKDLLDRHARATGQKKGHLIEQALLHHLAAIEALPADVVIAPRIVVTRASGALILAAMDEAAPTEALRKLMR